MSELDWQKIHDDLIEALMAEMPDTWDGDDSAEYLVTQFVKTIVRRLKQRGGSTQRWADERSIILNTDRERGRVVAYVHEEGGPEEQFLNHYNLDRNEVEHIRDAVRATAAVFGFTIKGTES